MFLAPSKKRLIGETSAVDYNSYLASTEQKARTLDKM